MADGLFVVEALSGGEWREVTASDTSWHASREAQDRSRRGLATRVRRRDTGEELVTYREGLAKAGASVARNPTL